MKKKTGAALPGAAGRRGKSIHKHVPSRKGINVALQGGGSHGAFTWGVLDRLLEDDRIIIDGISGTSAGAMNAVVVADGLMQGGREGARHARCMLSGAPSATQPV